MGWKVEQFWLNSETVMVEAWNSVVEQSWWNSETVMLEQCTWNSDAGTLRCNSVGERVWWNSGTVKMEQWKSDGETVCGTVEE